MGGFIKGILILVLILVVLLVGAVVVLPMVVDPNDYKPQIVDAVEGQIGRELVIEEDLSLTVFPWLGIETGGVRLGNAAGFEAKHFAEVERLGLKVKLMPLLSRSVEVDTLVLTGLRLNLEKASDGATNWQDLAEGSAAEESTPAEPAADGPGMAFSIQGIQIEDARIALDDRQAGKQFVLDGVRLVTGALTPGADVPVEAGVKFTSTAPAMTLDAALTMTVRANDALSTFSVSELLLLLDAAGEGLPAGGAKLELAADVEADTQADTLQMPRFEVSGLAMSAKGELSVTGLSTAPQAAGRIQIAETNPKTLASMFAVAIETADETALTKVAGDVTFAYADGALKLDPLSLSLDESTLKGHFHLLDPAKPVIRTRLDLDRIDLDRYMPPPTMAEAGEAPAQPSGDSAPSTQASDPFAALRPLDLVGEFTVGELVVSKARMQQVKAKIVAKDGVVKIDPMNAALYEGKFDGAVTLDASGEKPKLATRGDLAGIQIGPLLGDVASFDKLNGRGEVGLDLSLVGLTEAEIRRTLNGTARVSLKDGAVKGINVAQTIRDASQRLGLGGDRLDTGTPGQTDFSEMGASVTIRNGVVRNDDLHAKSPLLRVAGKGEVDLPADTINYLITTTLVGTLEGQGGKGGDELSGFPIPVRLTGPLTQPQITPDLEGVLKAKAEAQLEEKKQEVQQKLEKKLDEELGDKFKGLFGR